jgi:hypothetical protein
LELTSVSAIGVPAAPFASSCARSWASSPVNWEVVPSAWAASEPPGYQCTITKSALPAISGITVWFQSALSPSAITPSGQLPGIVSTAPTFTVGSTAFIAEA